MPNRPKLTKRLVIDYHKYMCREFDAELVDKKNAQEMIVVSQVLSTLGIMKPSDFLKRYATTIPQGVFGRPRIYIPWTPGEGHPYHLAKQIRVLGHECNHVSQMDKDPYFAIKYLFDLSERAHFEALATQTSFELYYWYYNRLPDFINFTSGLRHYGLRNGNLRVARAHLKLIQKMTGEGAVATVAGKAAIKWLNERTT